MAALTIPLAVLSLATAVKDAVEVAQQIRDAFKQVCESVLFRAMILWDWLGFCAMQVPENYRKAREMSEEILQFVQQINGLYEKGKDVFEREQSFKISLEGLLKYVYILDLRPSIVLILNQWNE